MKLYYFTGTGNSLVVARRLSREISGTELCPILGADPRERLTGAFGLVFPVHMVGVPVPVRRYLTSADFSGLDYFFAVGTHGGTPGNVGAYIDQLLGSRGSRLLDDYFSIEMLLNTPKGVAPRLLMTMNWVEKIRPVDVSAMSERVAAVIPKIAQAVTARCTTIRGSAENRARRAGILTRLLWKASDGSTPSLDFLLDSASCTGCGICGDVCPSGRIVLTGAVPHWVESQPCYFCYACFNFCPEQAIGVKHYTFKTGRYHHPEVGPDDMAEQKRAGHVIPRRRESG